MKKLLFALVLFFSCTLAHGQDSGWAAGAFFTPSYSYRTMKPELQTTDNSKDVALMNFDAGIRLSGHFSRFRITTGVTYALKGYKTTFDIDTVSVTGNKGTVPATEYKRYTFLEVPLYLTFKIRDSTFKFGILAGIANDFLLDYTTDVPSYDIATHSLLSTRTSLSGQDLKDQQYSTYYLNLLVGLEFGYAISDKLTLYAQPNFRYSFSNANPATAIADVQDIRLYNIGISFGVDYKF